MREVFKKIYDLSLKGEPFLVVTVIKSIGSAPQKEGAKMVIERNGSITGTVGGGNFEHIIIESRHEFFKETKPFIKKFNLLKDAKMSCGGVMEVLVEPFFNANRLVIFGAGHVAIALAKIAAFVGFDVIVFDDREEWANEKNFPDARKIVIGDFKNINIELFPEDYVVSVTRNHEFDFEVASFVLKNNVKYFGIIGSRRKAGEIFEKLKETGFSDDDVKKIYSPIGISIGSKTPEEIGISIMAQIIAVKRGKEV